VQPVDATRRTQAPNEASPHAGEVTACELRLTQAERFDEEHPIATRQAGHEMLLVRP
jgi:hypothetical protein